MAESTRLFFAFVLVFFSFLNVYTKENKCMNSISRFFKSPVLVYNIGHESYLDLFSIESNKLILTRNLNASEAECWVKPKQIVIFIGERDLETALPILVTDCFWNSYADILVFQKSDQDNHYDVSLDILQLMWQFTYSATVTVAVESDDYIHFYTWFPFQKDQCREVNKITLLHTSHSESILSKNVLFFNKVNIVRGCLFNVTLSFKYIPQTFWVGDVADGFEVRLLEWIANSINMSLHFVEPAPAISFFAVNFTHIGGGFMRLVTRESDLVGGAYRFSPMRLKLAEALPSHFTDYYEWFVPVPDPRPTWDAIFWVFSWSLWLLLLTSFLAFLIVLYLTMKTREKAKLMKVFLFLWASLLGLSDHFITIHTLTRFLLFLSAVYCLLVNAAFQSALIGFLMKTSYGKPLLTMSDALKNGLVPYVLPSVTAFSSEIPFWDDAVSSPFLVYTDDYKYFLTEVCNKRGIALFVKSISENFVNNKFVKGTGNSPMTTLPIEGIPFLNTFYMTRNHPLRDLMGRKLQQAVESGVIKWWFDDIVGTIVMKKCKSNQPISLSHLQGAFIFWCIGFLFSIAALFCEILSSNGSVTTARNAFNKSVNR